MASPTYTTALIVGAGHGLSASLTRRLRKEGLAVALAARDTVKLASLCTETGARAFTCDAQDEAQVQQLFADIAKPLIVAAGLDPKSTQVVLLNDSEINAFVATGQTVYIQSGLLTAASTTARS